MVTKKSNIIGIACLLLATTASAQNELDAFRHSQWESGITARSLALGGASGSIGGDFSSLSTNPAGLGVYRSSEMTITPTLRINNMRSDYLGNESLDDNASFNINNFGLVFAQAAKGRNYETSNWKSFSLGIGMNRLADFNRHGKFSGNNGHSSVSEIFSIDAVENGTASDIAPPLGYLGWEGFLLDEQFNAIPYDNIIRSGGSLDQTKTWRSKGSVNEYAISLGGNYREKLMLGATLGILSHRYQYNSRFLEQDATGKSDNDFNYLSYREFLEISGVGLNLKLGAIYVVNNYFRIGAAIHTPSWNSFAEQSDYDIVTDTENYKQKTNQDDISSRTEVVAPKPFAFNYTLRTPWRAIISATGFLGKKGFITADYEYVAYSSMRYGMSNEYTNFEESLNKAIDNSFKSGHNVRIGLEGRQDVFFGRLGFAYRMSPLEKHERFGGDMLDFSAGLGIRFGSMFTDLAFVHRRSTHREFAYPMQPNSHFEDLATLNNKNNLIVLTLGFKF